jgi:hypothetical protein
MCLVLLKTAEKQTATEDILVQKEFSIVNNKLYSLYHGYEWDEELHECKDAFQIDIDGVCLGGFDMAWEDMQVPNNIQYLSTGFHSFQDIETYRLLSNEYKKYFRYGIYSVYNCIIPKGAEYYLNEECGLYVSNQLKIIDKLYK